jgi:hypothetical protein
MPSPTPSTNTNTNANTTGQNCNPPGSCPASSVSSSPSVHPTSQAPVPAAPAPEKPVLTSITPGGAIPSDYMTDEEKAIQAMRAAGITPQSTPQQALPANIQKIIDDQKKQYMRPPLVIDEIDTSFPEEYTKGLPNTITVAVTSSYLWGARDIELINRTLGYPSQQIPAHCQLRLDGKILTDKDTFYGKVYAGQRSDIKYDGVVKNATFQPRAVCNPPKEAPQTGGVIMRIGNMSSVQLMQQVACPAPAKPPSSLEVQYTGDGTAKCTYR